MSDTEPRKPDRQTSPPPGPSVASAGRPSDRLEQALSRVTAAPQARAVAPPEPLRPIERLGAMRAALEAVVLNGKADRETPVDDRATRKATEHTHEHRPPGMKPGPTIQGPGQGPLYVGQVPVRSQEPATPQTPAGTPNREPTKAEKLYEKIMNSVENRTPIRPPLDKPDRGPDKGPDVER